MILLFVSCCMAMALISSSFAVQGQDPGQGSAFDNLGWDGPEDASDGLHVDLEASSLDG